MARAIASRPQGNRSRVMIAAAVLFAGIAAVLLFVALQSGGGDGGRITSAVATTDVIVATRDIDVNTKLTPDMFEITTVPITGALTGVYTTTEAAIGLPVRVPIQKGEQITAAKVGIEAIEEEKDLALVLNQGQRAFSVAAREITAVGGLLLPGNFVDVYVTFGDDTGGIPRAQLILPNIEVLDVAQEAQEPVPAPVQTEADGSEAAIVAGNGFTGQRSDDVERQPRARTITLAVTPDQSLLLAALQNPAVGDVEIWLALRPVGDGGNGTLTEIDLRQYRRPAPAE